MSEGRNAAGHLDDTSELAEVLLDRPGQGGAFCCKSFPCCPQADASDLELIDVILEQPGQGGIFSRGPCCPQDARDVELTDVALDRPRRGGAFCCEGTFHCSNDSHAVDLDDAELDRPRRGGAFCCEGTFKSAHDGYAVELDDAELDRPAHPNLACITVSTGEFSKHADSVDPSDDIALDRPLDGGSRFTGGLCQKTSGPSMGAVGADDLADTVVDRAGAAGFSSPCCSIKFSGV